MCDLFGCVMVNEADVKIVEQCGKFSHVAHPGFNLVLPCCCLCVNGSLSMRLQQIEARAASENANE